METHYTQEKLMSNSLTYAEAGVDIKKAARLIEKIKDIAKQTPDPG